MRQWIKRDFSRILPVFIFFFIAFNIINWMDSFLLKRSGMEPFSILSIAIAAALVAKIFLLIEHLPIEAPVRKKPLAYLVVWKTLLYWVITLIVRLGIRFWPYLFLKEGFRGEVKAFFQQIDWDLFFVVQTWYLMLLFFYILCRELSKVIGKDQLRRIFFGR